MKVSISKDQYGIQLCTDREECDCCLDLRDKQDLIDIRNEIDEYLIFDGLSIDEKEGEPEEK